MEENKNNKSTLDQLKQMNESESIPSVSFQERELKQFQTSNVFEKQAPKKKSRLSRKERKAQEVKIKNYTEPMPDFSKRVSEAQKAAKRNDTDSAAIKTIAQPDDKDIEIHQVTDEDLFDGKTGRLNANDLSKTLEATQDTITISPVAPAAQEEETVEDTQDIKTESVVVQNVTAHMEPIKIEEEPAYIESVQEEKIVLVSDEDNKPSQYAEDDFKNMDESDLDLYQDKKNYTLANYPKIEEYLAQQSAQGYHFYKADGKVYYFVKSKPKPYYYEYTYFKEEPTQDELDALKDQGWIEISRIPGRNKKEAGWIIFRNRKYPNQSMKEIDNDQQKLRYFKKQASSYRSTMFLIFICMVCCAITAWLQFFLYRGYWEILAVCGVVFVICLISFFIYSRYLRRSRKRAKLLKAKIKSARLNPKVVNDESDLELDEEWKALEN